MTIALYILTAWLALGALELAAALALDFHVRLRTRRFDRDLEAAGLRVFFPSTSKNGLSA